MDGIALVTGGNRGIGREVARQLAGKGFTVVLTARTEVKAREAADALMKEGLKVEPLALDVTSTASAGAAARAVASTHGRLDVLVNNAAVLLDQDDWGGGLSTLDEGTLRNTLETNVLGVHRVATAFLPLLRKSKKARVVNVSSGAGQLEGMGLGAPAYKISKTALNALTKILAAETAGDGMLVNAACPGWVKTDMGGAGATRPVEEGAKGIVWLATLPAGGPTGGFYRDGKEIGW